jgi:hypothetical protein
MSFTNLSSSNPHASFQPSTRAIARVMALASFASLSWGLLVSVPINAAQAPSGTARTEESEKCEWLGVCDASETSNHVARATESDQCTWLGICD